MSPSLWLSLAVVVLVVIVILQQITIRRLTPKVKAYITGLRRVEGHNVYGVFIQELQAFLSETETFTQDSNKAKSFPKKSLAFEYARKKGYSTDY